MVDRAQRTVAVTVVRSQRILLSLFIWLSLAP